MNEKEEIPEDVIEFANQIFDAVRAGNKDFVTAAIDQGAPANLTDAKGNTLIMLAAYHGHAELTEALAVRGADVNRFNDRGQTPLAGAVFKKYGEIVKALMRHGADPDIGSPTARQTAEMFEATELLSS